MAKLEKIVSDVLNIGENKVTDSLSPATCSSWDSFSGILLVSEIEKQFGIRISMEEALGIKNVGDIRKIVEKKAKPKQ